MFLTPKGIRSALKMPQVPPRRLEPNWLDFYFFIINERGNTSDFYVFPHQKQFNTAIYTNLLHGLDMKYRENTGYQGHLQVNKYYVNLAVKFPWN